MDKTLKISKIKEGTVIDHIAAGKALKVLAILGIDESNSISIGIRVMSEKLTFKDVIKIENKFLEKIELDKIALIANEATISIIKNYEIIEKFNLDMPQTFKGIVKCGNQNCITNAGEPVKSEFKTVGTNPLTIKCIYCKKEMSGEEIINNV
ncbi:MAG: aspartate carbamoyltransferase regulatory subunit [Candidatus Thermoplasmatota archaeon]|jgi:aspartate carbamoyltransferase regulatory subunit|uniref:aspartate carbamoyltransferase regulatory subunit n=1 Tax=Ferroplasma sp. TaxID=2591003 RepID=UPI002634828A|nr:aspartate carbamoyltransferase regulatory subunit [Ferroplasma sp.]MCL4311314.1 aspartate carbamoyltransferase regulatory subunit [Candidatus Thermoplasmatota archaeon]